MKQIIKDDSNIPTEYLKLIKRKRVRKQDINAGYYRNTTGRKLFIELKKKCKFQLFKEKLLDDQGYICCYCNDRVISQGSIVEHLIPISKDKSLLAEYDNLLIACNGGKEEQFLAKNNFGNIEEYPLYCDAHRGNRDLPFTPLDARCEDEFIYFVNGSIYGKTADANNLIDVLNLNCRILQQRRKEAISILFGDNNEIISEDEIIKIKDSICVKNSENMFHKFCFTILSVIESI